MANPHSSFPLLTFFLGPFCVFPPTEVQSRRWSAGSPALPALRSTSACTPCAASGAQVCALSLCHSFSLVMFETFMSNEISHRLSIRSSNPQFFIVSPSLTLPCRAGCGGSFRLPLTAFASLPFGWAVCPASYVPRLSFFLFAFLQL